MSKIFGWLKSLDNFFQKDNQGKDIYYPWSYPGEAFYINKKQEILIILFSWILAIFFLITVFGVIYADHQNMISLSKITDCIVMSSTMLLTILYILLMYILGKFTDFYILPKDKRPPKKINKGWIVLCFPIYQIFLTVLSNNWISMMSIAFVMMNIAYIFFITGFLIKLKRTQGYCFSDKG